jgi:tetratricopeptide (TPR) repeat protein
MHQKLGDLYASNGNFYKAFKEYYALIMAYPHANAYYYKSAQFLDLKKEYKNEIRILQSIPNYDTDSYALLQCGKVFLDLKEFGKSIACLQKAQNQNAITENRIAILRTLYTAYKDSGLTGQSDAVLEEIMKIDPNFSPEQVKSSRYIVLPQEVKSYIEQGKLLISQGKLDEAVQVLKQSLQLKETAYANMLIGNILVQQRKIEALTFLEKAYVEIKDNPALLNRLCVMYTIQKDYEKATAMLNEIKKIVGENDPKVIELEKMIHKQMSSKK